MNSDFCVAVHGLVYLSHKNTTLSSEELAENICTNPVRVRRVMAKLRRAGLVTTREGAEGGYALAVPTQSISLRQVARALDAHFVEVNWRSGDPDKPCLISSGMGDIMADLIHELDTCCNQRLEQKTIDTIERQIFSNNR